MDGIKRLEEMLKGQKDKYLIKIVNYLMLQTEMNEAFLNEEKDLKEMASYIKNKAREQATDNVAVIDDDEVYQWAKDYFNKSNEELSIKKVNSKVDNKKKRQNNDKFGSIFEDLSEEKTDTVEQISLF